MPSFSSRLKLTRVMKSLVSLITNAPVIGFLVPPALNLPFDLSHDSLLLTYLFWEVCQLSIKNSVILIWVTAICSYWLVWSLTFRLRNRRFILALFRLYRIIIGIFFALISKIEVITLLILREYSWPLETRISFGLRFLN